MRHFLSILDRTPAELNGLLDRADELASAWHAGVMPRSLEGRPVALWFYGQGFRNRAAFEIGARAMGASVTQLPGELGVQEPLEDVGHYLDKWFDILVVRTRRHADLLVLADSTDAAVVNARTDRNHPCEILGDLQYIRRRRGSLDGLDVVFLGEESNLCGSWFEAAARFPIRVTQIAPPEHLADGESLAAYREGAVGEIRIRESLDGCLERTDLLYTDCWPHTDDPGEKARIAARFLPYQVTGAMLSRMRTDALFLPCPPVTRGQEVSAEAMRSPLCRNHEAKEYLLHAQNAILEEVSGTRPRNG
ncbi:MAG: ornithine carbamoyltransferase [Clostridia bacterium]|nr:ornithine carbamoyltransferase [Clostridia bacterium]